MFPDYVPQNIYAGHGKSFTMIRLIAAIVIAVLSLNGAASAQQAGQSVVWVQIEAHPSLRGLLCTHHTCVFAAVTSLDMGHLFPPT